MWRFPAAFTFALRFGVANYQKMIMPLANVLEGCWKLEMEHMVVFVDQDSSVLLQRDLIWLRGSVVWIQNEFELVLVDTAFYDASKV